MKRRAQSFAVILLSFLGVGVPAACAQGGSGSACGPTDATVARVIDGDTIELVGGEKVRYLLIDTPEVTGATPACYGPEAEAFNSDLVDGKDITLSYDVQCRDQYGRLLAYVSVNGREVNRILVERGYACVDFIPPDGQDRVTEFQNLELAAKAQNLGLWGACAEVPCK